MFPFTSLSWIIYRKNVVPVLIQNTSVLGRFRMMGHLNENKRADKSHMWEVVFK